jgi:hypothetical protein
MDNEEFREKIKDLSGNELRDVVMKEKKCQMVLFVCRQTDYTEEEAIEKLEKTNYNGKEVVEEYLCPNKEKIEEEEKDDVSINQQIYGEIRGLMDGALKEWERKKQIDAMMKAKYEYLQKNKM